MPVRLRARGIERSNRTEPGVRSETNVEWQDQPRVTLHGSRDRASLGNAAEVAGLAVGQMMTPLEEFGVRARLDQEDYRQSLKNLAEVW